MYFSNNVEHVKIKVTDNKLKIYEFTTDLSIDMIDPKKIYKCSIYHNIVEFATNPIDLSWCGIAFPYGNRSDSSSLTIKSIFLRG